MAFPESFLDELIAKNNKDIDQLYKQADLALYKAKSEGKNRVIFYNEMN